MCPLGCLAPIIQSQTAWKCEAERPTEGKRLVSKKTIKKMVHLLRRSLQKFLPLLLTTESTKGRANSVGSKSIDLDEASFASFAESASEIGSSGRIFIPRQRILVARVIKSGIELYTYNYSKECADRLAKHLVRSFSHYILF